MLPLRVRYQKEWSHKFNIHIWIYQLKKKKTILKNVETLQGVTRRSGLIYPSFILPLELVEILGYTKFEENRNRLSYFINLKLFKMFTPCEGGIRWSDLSQLQTSHRCDRCVKLEAKVTIILHSIKIMIIHNFYPWWMWYQKRRAKSFLLVRYVEPFDQKKHRLDKYQNKFFS